MAVPLVGAVVTLGTVTLDKLAGVFALDVSLVKTGMLMVLPLLVVVTESATAIIRQLDAAVRVADVTGEVQPEVLSLAKSL